MDAFFDMLYVINLKMLSTIIYVKGFCRITLYNISYVKVSWAPHPVLISQ